MTTHTDRFLPQQRPFQLPHGVLKRERRRQTAHLGCGLFAALAIVLTATRALACFATPFTETIETAPLVVRANVKAITDLPRGDKQVELVESRTLVGIELGRSLTLRLDEDQAENFQPGGQYFIALADPHTPFYTRNRCGTVFSVQVISGKVPGYNRRSAEPYTMAATERDIRARRCQVTGHCPHLCSEPKRSGPLTRSQTFFYLGMLAVGGYAALLLRRRRPQAATSSAAPAAGLLQGAIERILNLLSPPLHR